MARPIAATPMLDAKATQEFLARIDRDRDKPMGPIPTTRVDDVIKKIMADATERKK